MWADPGVGYHLPVPSGQVSAAIRGRFCEVVVALVMMMATLSMLPTSLVVLVVNPTFLLRRGFCVEPPRRGLVGADFGQNNDDMGVGRLMSEW